MEKKSTPTVRNLIAQINEIINILKEHKDPIEITPDLLADIKKLELVVTRFKEENQDILRLFETKESLESNRLSEGGLPIRMTEELIEAEIMKLALSKKRKKKSKKDLTDPSTHYEKQRMKERKKIFKTIGGDQKWIPL